MHIKINFISFYQKLVNQNVKRENHIKVKFHVFKLLQKNNLIMLILMHFYKKFNKLDLGKFYINFNKSP